MTDQPQDEPAVTTPAPGTSDSIVAGTVARRSARRWRVIAFVALVAWRAPPVVVVAFCGAAGVASTLI